MHRRIRVGFIVLAALVAAVTGNAQDTRTVTEPTIPTVCTTLTAALTSVNDDIPASVDATVTNPDGTISIYVNGEHKRVPAGLTILGLAEELGLVPEKLAASVTPGRRGNPA